MFGIEHYDVEPEIMTMAKGIANGMPLGATIATEEVADSLKNLTISTFGGNPSVLTNYIHCYLKIFFWWSNKSANALNRLGNHGGHGPRSAHFDHVTEIFHAGSDEFVVRQVPERTAVLVTVVNVGDRKWTETGG